MASITLEDAWFNLASDLTQSVTVTLTNASETDTKPTEVRRRANGRLQAVTRAGSARVLTLKFDLVDRGDLETLRSWKSQVVMYRDPRGRKLWCVYAEVLSDEIPGAEREVLNASITATEVSHDEEV